MTDRIGYRIAEPPGWVRLVADVPDPVKVRTLAKRIASAADPRVRAKVETFVYDQLFGALTEASARGGTDMFLSTELIDGVPLQMTIVVGVAPLSEFGKATNQTDAMLAYVARTRGAKATEVGGSLAVRSSVDVAAIEGTEDAARAFDTRRVSYVIAAPTDDKRLLIVSSSIRREKGDLESSMLEAMEFLFDAMVATIRFQPVGVSA